MDGSAPITAKRHGDARGEAFAITSPAAGASATAVVFATPHSGRIYPETLMTASRLDATAIRRSEDAYVDTLIDGAPAHGITVIAARLARAWLDVNREPWELDASMFEDEVPAYARGVTAKVAAGLGSIARVVGDGQEIYRRKLKFAEASDRVEAVHVPYHAALTSLLTATRRRSGVAVMVDWHSMPSAAVSSGCDIVLGDRYGGACAPKVTRLVERCLVDLGYRVSRNAPYAGGYTTQHYGRPHRGVHALQIEINRALYMDEKVLAPSAGFVRLKTDLERVFAALAQNDWGSM